MQELNEYFGCDAYDKNNSVYILDDNGFKQFNANKVELIKGHNVFSVLKKMEYLHDSSFDKTERELNEKGVSYSNAILDGTEYFYVLKRMVMRQHRQSAEAPMNWQRQFRSLP